MGKNRSWKDVKAIELPKEVPTDYLKYNGFVPCFGYVYVVKFKDVAPCFFKVHSGLILVLQEHNHKLLTFSFEIPGMGLFTCEETRRENILEICKAKRKEDYLAFTARPRPDKCFKDWNDLKVMPFHIEEIVSGDRPVKTKRKFEVLV